MSPARGKSKAPGPKNRCVHATEIKTESKGKTSTNWVSHCLRLFQRYFNFFAAGKVNMRGKSEIQLRTSPVHQI